MTAPRNSLALACRCGLLSPCAHPPNRAGLGAAMRRTAYPLSFVGYFPLKQAVQYERPSGSPAAAVSPAMER